MTVQAKNFLARKRIKLEEILYIIREDGKTVIHLDDGRTRETFITMKAFMEELPEEDFIRVNKGYILPVAKISEVVGGIYRMIDGRIFEGRVKGRTMHNHAAQAVAQRGVEDAISAGLPGKTDTWVVDGSHEVVGASRFNGAYDDLTKLLVSEAFVAAAAGAVKNDSEGDYVILCSDIDNFKYANERLGSARCDELLKRLAEILSSTLPGYVMGGRLTGISFCFLLKSVSFAQIDNALNAVSTWEQKAGTGLSFGFVKVDPTMPMHAVIARAQMALKDVKGVYGKRLSEYDEAMGASAALANQIANDAEEALSTRQFKMVYQPKIDAKTREVCGAEALVRWHHPKLGLIPNGDYIPLFERVGLIPRLDEYVCHEVCRDLAGWIAQGIDVVPVSINLSRYDFTRKNLADVYCALVDSYKVPRDLIRFEMTGSVYLNDGSLAQQQAKKLREYGFKIELDDFGVGYSSVSSLGSMQFDVVKLDNELIDNMSTDTGSIILRSVVRLANGLGLVTVAEGVESEEQYQKLVEFGCDCVQGYHFSKPLPKEEYLDYLQASRRR